jgi:hypothetical protein
METSMSLRIKAAVSLLICFRKPSHKRLLTLIHTKIVRRLNPYKIDVRIKSLLTQAWLKPLTPPTALGACVQRGGSCKGLFPREQS